MQEFESLMKQAVSIKSSQSAAKRKKFDALPLFIKCGLYYSEKFANVREQEFFPRYFCCELLKNTGNQMYQEGEHDKAARSYEQVNIHLLNASSPTIPLDCRHFRYFVL